MHAISPRACEIELINLSLNQWVWSLVRSGWSGREEMELAGLRVAARYDVVKRLQSGYYGTAWLARDQGQEPEEEVCLKASSCVCSCEGG